MNFEKSFPYTEDMIESENIFLNHLHDFISNPRLKQFPEEKLQIGNFASLNYGMNKGEKVPIELKNRLEKNVDSEILKLDLENIDYKTDIVVIGTGGTGLSAGREAAEIAKKKEFSKKLSLDFLLENNLLALDESTR